MTDVKPIADYCRRSFARPELDPSWIRDCLQALVDDGQDPTPSAVHEQFLYSDLEQSSKPCIPHSAVAAHGTRLFPSPTLLQVLSLTEIGASAYHLQTTLEQRRDVLQGRTQIRGMDDNEEGEQGLTELEPGKLPDYPRSMLRLELGDGRLVLKAVEYRRISDLKLGDTPLGTKLVLHNVPIKRGILMLAPDNTRLMGGMIEHLEAEQPEHFVAGIKKRLEMANFGEGVTVSGSITRTTLSSLPRATAKTRITAKSQQDEANPQSLRASRPLKQTRQKQDAEYAGPSLPPPSSSVSTAAARRRAAMLAAQAEVDSIPIDLTDEFDETFEDESFLRHVEAAEAAARSTSGQTLPTVVRREPVTLEDEEYDDFGDDSFLQGIEDHVLINPSTAIGGRRNQPIEILDDSD